MPSDPQRFPLDPRTVECEACEPPGSGQDFITPESRCPDCAGTGRVPLHPEPVVEVCRPEGTATEQYAFKLHGDRYAGPQVHDTPTEALRAARLAWLGAELAERDGVWAVTITTSDNLKMWTRTTPDDAIAAAFAAREGDDA